MSALTGCSKGDTAGPATPSITTISAVSRAGQPGASDVTSPSQAPSSASSPSAASPSNASASLPAGVFPGAGGPAPSDAVELTQQEADGSYLVTTELRINGCEFNQYAAFCTTTGKTAPPPDPSVDGGFLSVNLAKNPLHTEGYGTDAPQWTRSGTVLAYGKTARWKNYVCGAAENGLTCWNTDTHHGALINRSGITLF